MLGMGNNKFDPHGTTSRAMIVTILYRLEGEPTISGKNPFVDVKNGTWYTDAVIWAEENGIVDGYGEGKFGPDDAITREQLAAIMLRYAVYKGMDALTMEENLHFDDASEISEYAVSAMNWAAKSPEQNLRSGAANWERSRAWYWLKEPAKLEAADPANSSVWW